MAGSKLGGWIEPLLLSPACEELAAFVYEGKVKSTSVELGLQVDTARV